MSSYLLLVVWLCVLAALCYWAARRFAAPPNHGAIFAGSVVVAFLAGWLYHTGGGAERAPTAAVVPPAPVESVDPALYHDALSGLQFPTSAGAQRDVSGSIIVQNTGRATWSVHATPAILLAFHVVDAGGRVVSEGRAKLDADFAPHDKRRVAFVVRTPATPGGYTVRFDMIYETIRWFESWGNRAMVQTLTVK